MASGDKFVYYLLLFSVVSSSLMFPFIEIISLVIGWRLQNTYNIGVRNPDALQELGCLDYVVFNKTGVIATGDYMINEIMTPSCMYKVHDTAS